MSQRTEWRISCAALNLRRLVNLGFTHTSDGTWALA